MELVTKKTLRIYSGRSHPKLADDIAARLGVPLGEVNVREFPNGEIQQLDAEEEDGVMVYDFEFKAGDRQKEADIAGNGTMMESTLVITAKDIPPAAMKSIQKVANGAKLGRMEWLETFYKTKEGKLVKLSKSEIHYATAELRAAARRDGDADSFNLWAGEAYSLARDAPAASNPRRLGRR